MSSAGHNSLQAAAPGTAEAAPSRAEALEAAWRAYFERAGERPAHPGARDFLYRDVAAALGRLIPPDATVLEAGSAEGDLLASLPNPRRRGIDYLPSIVARARCSALFTEATVDSSSSATSGAVQPSTSRKISTARWRPGSSWIARTRASSIPSRIA